MTLPDPEQRWRDPHRPHASAGYDEWTTPGRTDRAAADSGAADPGGTGPDPDGGSAKDTAKAVGRGVAATARGMRTAGRFAMTTARKAADAQGAAASGLNRLLEMHAFNTAGDAAVAISLAGSLFFSMPGSGGESSRSHVALFLGITMLPFAIVAPLLGPFLDRVAHGRRWAIGATMAIRAFLCWILAGAITDGSLLMFPTVLGILVMSKAYGTTRAAAVPRLIPEGFTLVKTNGRVSMAGMAGVCVSAPIAGLCALVGPGWVLRYAALLFVVATILAIRLPGKIDQSAGEGTMTFTGGETQPLGTRGRQRVVIPPSVSFALRANVGPKWLYGFLLMFFTFLVQEHPIGGLSGTLLIGIVAGAAGTGNFLGVAAASLLRNIRPQTTVAAVLLMDAGTTLVCALFYNVLTLALLGLVTGFGASLAKFALDSTIQRDIPPRVHTSAFARSDTTLQLAWVVGGFVGIGLPLNAHLGLWVAFVVLTAWAAYVLAAPRPTVTVDRA
ncbi:MAG: MFS transporter [Nocardioides sp.]|uniref:MFS transporter n=1 Tax=Nocardioides sp. TaxID=35761 RepID=UPI0039E33CEB